ncbi:MAG: hypothetical protein AAGC77_00440 [Pseudomonadota bacterium]
MNRQGMPLSGPAIAFAVEAAGYSALLVERKGKGGAAQGTVLRKILPGAAATGLISRYNADRKEKGPPTCG